VLPADDPDAPAGLIEEVWPGYLVGGMLLARAIRAPQRQSGHKGTLRAPPLYCCG
jgi:hypothetical protein